MITFESALVAAMVKINKPVGRRNLRKDWVMNMRKKAHAQRGTKIECTTNHAREAIEISISQRAGYPLLPTKVHPKDWKPFDDEPIDVDFSRASWLPDDFGQGVKLTKKVARSKPGQGGTYTVWVSSDGRVFYHKPAVEEFVGRKLGSKDGFKGQVRLNSLQTKLTNENAFFNILTPQEKRNLPSTDQLHFCIISARRADKADGIAGIAATQAALTGAGIDPIWYVDQQSLDQYKALGLKCKVGGKLCPARNMALDDAKKENKVCVQLSDDISKFQYHHGKQVKERNDAAMNKAFKNAVCHVITPVAAARFLVAKMRTCTTPPQLGGVFPLASCARGFCGEEVTRKQFILGDFFVVDLHSKVRFDEKLSLKEDYDFTCRHIFTHGSVLRANRMTISAKHRVNNGGACSIRSGSEEDKNIVILKRKWPRAIRDQRREHEVTLSWPADDDPCGTKRSSSNNRNIPKSGISKRSSIKSCSKSSASSKTSKKSKKFSNIITQSKFTKKTQIKVPADLSPSKTISIGSGTPSSEYIKQRCLKVSGKKVKEALEDFAYKGDNGTMTKYRLSDLKYDLMRNYLKLARR